MPQIPAAVQYERESEWQPPPGTPVFFILKCGFTSHHQSMKGLECRLEDLVCKARGRREDSDEEWWFILAGGSQKGFKQGSGETGSVFWSDASWGGHGSRLSQRPHQPYWRDDDRCGGGERKPLHREQALWKLCRHALWHLWGFPNQCKGEVIILKRQVTFT